MMRLLAIADDLTGALEAGAKFAAQGIPSVVSTQPVANSDCAVVVIDTESRHLSEERAQRSVLDAARFASPIIYKKTDSALRGNIRGELRALSQAFPDHPISYIPAYPGLGRMVKAGHLYIDGVLVHETPFGKDPLNPVANSSLRSVLGEDLPCVIYDAETDEEIERSVADALAASQRCILAGPASVAAELAKQLRLPRQRPDLWPRVRTCTIVNGSLHPASERQIRFAEQNGCVSSEDGAAWRAAPPAALAGFDLKAADGVMIFGGDTAFCFWRSIGCPDLKPIGEIVSGVPVSRIPGRDLLLISKAGSFGNEDLICEVKRKLNVCK